MMRQLVLTTVALLLAVAAQDRLAHDAPPLLVLALFLAAVGLAIRFFPQWTAESSPPVGRPPPARSSLNEPDLAARSWPALRRWLLVAAWLAQAGAMVLAARGGGWPWDWLLWVFSLLAFLAALTDQEWCARLRATSHWEWFVLGMILALAMLVRVYHIDQVPPTVHGDEAESGLNAQRILRGEQTSFFDTGWYRLPTASFAAQAGVMYLFGDNLFGLRLSSALFGTFTLLPVYLLARSMFDRRVALAAAGLMAAGHWPVHFSRLGINYIQATFFTAWGIYMAWRALRTSHVLDYALTGLALGLGLYTYYGARLMPFVVGVLLLSVIGSALWRRQAARHLLGLSALVTAGILTVGPQALHFIKYPEQLVSRQRGVFFFDNLSHLEYGYRTENWGDILGQQVIKSLLVFNARGDSSGQYGFDEPMLDQVTAGLMVVGLGLSLWRWRRGGHWVLHLWFWSHLALGSALTIDAPFVPRLSAIMPVPFIWAGLALGGWWRQASLLARDEHQTPSLSKSRGDSVLFSKKTLSSIPAIAVLFLAGWTNYDAYVNRYVHQRQVTLSPSDAVRLVSSLPATTQVYLMGTPNIYSDFGTFRFLAPDALIRDVVNVVDWVPVRNPDPPDTMFLLWHSHLDRLPYLKQIYPTGDYQPYIDQNGVFLFATYFVPAPSIRRGQGLTAHIYAPDQWAGEPLARTSPVQVGLATLEEQFIQASVTGDHRLNAINVVWEGTLWSPDSRTREFCLEGEGVAYLQVGEARIDSPHTAEGCQGLFLTLDMPAGPHPVQAGATLDGTGAVALYWRAAGEEWVDVPPYVLWTEAWTGGLQGTFEQDGNVVQQTIAPLIAYRDFSRDLAGLIHAHWAGCLKTDVAGEYEFRVRSFDGARMLVESQLLILDEHERELREATAQMKMSQGTHPVRLEAHFTDGPRWLEWYWRPPGGEWELVPPQALSLPSTNCPVTD